MTADADRIVLVCSACLRAACFDGRFYCEEYRTARVVRKTIRQLQALGLEHPSNWKPE